MLKLFISYRREDSAALSGRLFDRLQLHFGRESVFFDVDSIPFGVDFRNYLGDAVGKCDVLLAVIGDRWTTSSHNGEARLNDPKDFVRIEIEAALARSITVIPVLIGKTPMPREEELPSSLRPLAFRNACNLDLGPDFHVHVDRLIRGLERLGMSVEQKRSVPLSSTLRPKYYLYISDIKVEMLLAQIPQRALEEITSELGLSRSERNTAMSDTHLLDRYARTAIISKYIEKYQDTGTIDSPSSFFTGKVTLRWGIYGNTQAVVYFGGKTDQTFFGLGGSSRHLIGNDRGSPTDSHGSYTPYMLAALREDIPEIKGLSHADLGVDPEEAECGALTAVYWANSNLGGPSQRVEFLAKRLLFAPKGCAAVELPESPRNVLLGTPIYVAMAD